MATRITCIIPHPNDPEKRIAGVGGLHGWTEWELQIIGEIEDGANYYVEVKDHERVDLVVGQQGGRKYLTSDPDHERHQPAPLLTPLPLRLNWRD